MKYLIMILLLSACTTTERKIEVAGKIYKCNEMVIEGPKCHKIDVHYLAHGELAQFNLDQKTCEFSFLNNERKIKCGEEVYVSSERNSQCIVAEIDSYKLMLCWD